MFRSFEQIIKRVDNYEDNQFINYSDDSFAQVIKMRAVPVDYKAL